MFIILMDVYKYRPGFGTPKPPDPHPPRIGFYFKIDIDFCGFNQIILYLRKQPRNSVQNCLRLSLRKPPLFNTRRYVVNEKSGCFLWYRPQTMALSSKDFPAQTRCEIVTQSERVYTCVHSFVTYLPHPAPKSAKMRCALYMDVCFWLRLSPLVQFLYQIGALVGQQVGCTQTNE